MPTRKTNNSVSNTEQVNVNNSNNNTDAIIASLMEQIANLQKQIQENSKPTQQNNSVSIMDRPCTLIHLVECHPSLPTTIKVNNNEIRFTKFGEQRTFRFFDMQDIISRYREWFERGIFTLGNDCDDFKNEFGINFFDMPMPINKYNTIAELPITEFKRIVSNMNYNQSVFLAKTWVDRYQKHIRGYDNIEKIRILNKKTNGFMKEFISTLLEEE